MKKLLVYAVMVFVFVASCGKGEVKKVSEDSKIATEAFALAEKIRDAYVKRDISGIESNTTRDGFRTISSTLKTFDSVVLTFTPAWVEIEGNVVHLNISWKGTWQKSGKITEERGMAVFVLKGRPLKVDNILRANPFRYPTE
ncbi:lipoprotein [Dissulfurispira thermophila]|uniref:Lipoprotein n=2 Tax=root TaxID=1 RepID=A0A7G1H3F9_9BACT|nr:hypothetical protein [Dissulfurispira thermophila]BCB97350.1 lipoprotein [Dissulfurispira thermophila]